MQLIYPKGAKDDLSAAEKKALRKLNQDWWDVSRESVKALRAKLGLSQPKFAKLLHVDVGTPRKALAA